MDSLQVKAPGLWLATLGGIGQLTHSTTADGGSERASWVMNLPRTFGHPLLRTGTKIDLVAGSMPIWAGTLTEPVYDPTQGWLFTALGAIGDGDNGNGYGYLAFDADNNTSSTPDTVVDQAIARGLSWNRPDSLSADAFASTGTTDQLNTVNGLLTAWATSVSKRIRVDGDRSVGAFTDPTVPDWYLMPGIGQVGLADEDYVSDIFLRYNDTATTFATVHVSDPIASAFYRREYGVDATTLGVTTEAAVTDVGNGLLAKGSARYAVTDSLNPSRFQLTTPGGTPAFLPSVRGGQLVRMLGVRREQGAPLTHFDFVIGRTEYVAGADTILIAPVGLAARTLTDVLKVALNGAVA